MSGADPTPQARSPIEDSARTAEVGLRLLRELLTVALLVHVLNAGSGLLEETWKALYGWEVLGAGVCGAALLAWRPLPARHRPLLLAIPVLFCAARWGWGWSLGGPHEVYTSTVSLLLYLPFLVCISLLLRVRTWLVMGVLGVLACVSVYGALRPEFAGGVLEEWRVGPSVLAAGFLLSTLFHRWRRHDEELAHTRGREQHLSDELEATTARHLEERMAAVERISGALAHELNNLLAVSLPLSHGLVADLEGEHQQDAQDILDSSERARRLGQRLRLLTRSQASGVETHALNALLATERPRLQRAIGDEHPLEAALASAPCPVRIDAGDLLLLLEHLLTNAAEASPPGTPVGLSVEIPPTRPPEVVITVSDRGHGFHPDLLSRAFDPYVTTHEDSGRGLGLTTAYAIATRAGGSLSLRNRPGGGAEVVLRLLQAVDAATEAEAAAGPETSARAPGAIGAPTLDRPLRVMVVDDEPMVLRATRRVLARQGFDVTSHVSPVEALRALQEEAEPFDVVLSDVRMPVLNGPQLRRRAIEALAQPPPFVFMTGHIDAESASLIGVPPERILHKPCAPDVLVSSLHHAYGGG